jgi:hypothetical protein
MRNPADQPAITLPSVVPAHAGTHIPEVVRATGAKLE